jgi:hypothetical protein
VKLGEAVLRQQSKFQELQQQLRDQHTQHIDLQRQMLEASALRGNGGSLPGSKELEQQLGRVETVVVSKVERTMTATLHKENILLTHTQYSQ